MKKLIVLSLVCAGSIYAMDPIASERKNNRVVAQSGEHEVAPQETKKASEDVQHGKFCLETYYTSSQECSCRLARVKSAEKISQMVRYLTSSRE